MNDPKEKRANVYMGRRLMDDSLYVQVNGKELLPTASQKVWNHSPDGFNWGYAGSGPAQLALAILLNEYGDAGLALDLYQQFKVAFVVCWPQGPGTSWALSSATIDAWLATHEWGPRRAAPAE